MLVFCLAAEAYESPPLMWWLSRDCRILTRCKYYLFLLKRSLFLPHLKSFIELFFFQLLFYLFLGVLVIVLMRVVPSDLSFCELGVAGVACVLHVCAETTAVLAERGKRSVCLSGQRHTLFLQDFACCFLFWLRNGETANST
jgi:hypothetical protein